MVSVLKSGLSTILEGVISRTIIYGAVLNRTGELPALSWRHTVVSLPCTISGSAVICLKESDLVVTQSGRTSEDSTW